MNCLDKISALRSTCEQGAKLSELKTELSTPLLTDTQYIPVIYDWFCELSVPHRIDREELTNPQKAEFLFIILAIYSPITLAGGKLMNGLRDKLAALLGYKSPSAVSNFIAADLYFHYTHTGHKESIDRIYEEIWKRLEERGILL